LAVRGADGPARRGDEVNEICGARLLDAGARILEADEAEWGPAEIFSGDLGPEIAELKARDDEGTVLVHGGPDFAKSLTRLGLVDEYQLTTVPIAIGAGHSPFADLEAHLKLDVVEEERFRSGALAQILAPKR
jgi:dihydrofolate reductase